MIVTVKVKKSQVDHFRRIARGTHLEILAYLVGEVKKPHEVHISRLAYTRQYNKQTTLTVAWSGKEYERVVKEANSEGKRIVGFIHSHPKWDAVLSPADFSIMAEDGFRICGICSTSGRRTRVRFWVPESSLPCKIDYA